MPGCPCDCIVTRWCAVAWFHWDVARKAANKGGHKGAKQTKSRPSKEKSVVSPKEVEVKAPLALDLAEVAPLLPR